MFRVCLFLFTLAVVAALGFLIFPCRPKDIAMYEELLQSSNPLKKDDSLACSQQKRLKVCKRIWYQDKTPLHILIESPESELFLLQQDNLFEITEKLKSVACVMQEELYYVDGKPMQKVRYLEAERACYHYHSHLFIAEDVKLWKFELEGHAPPESLEHQFPLMSATAQTVEFTLKGEKLDFTAHHMRAIFNTKERSI